jgi:hypothetical protein
MKIEENNKAQFDVDGTAAGMAMAAAEGYGEVAEVCGGAVVQACGGGVTKVIRTRNSNGTRH